MSSRVYFLSRILNSTIPLFTNCLLTHSRNPFSVFIKPTRQKRRDDGNVITQGRQIYKRPKTTTFQAFCQYSGRMNVGIFHSVVTWHGRCVDMFLNPLQLHWKISDDSKNRKREMTANVMTQRDRSAKRYFLFARLLCARQFRRPGRAAAVDAGIYY